MIAKKLISVMLTALLLTEQLPLSAGAAEREVITVSAENSFAVCEGWGTDLYRWGERLGRKNDICRQAADLLYGDDGLKMNIIRYNVGGGDSPEHNHFTDKDTMIPSWWNADLLDAEKLSYTLTARDTSQINALKKSAEAAGSSAKVELYSFSPPYFMTVSGCTAGAVYSGSDNIRNDCYDNYAAYLAGIAAKLKTSGVNVNSIAPMYEPSSLHWKAGSELQEGCHISQGKAQSKLILSLRTALNSKGLGTVQISAADEADMSAAAAGLNALDAKARQTVNKVNIHSTDTASAEQLISAADETPVRITEADGLYTAGENAGEMSSALGLGRQMIADLTRAEASAWVMYQAVTDSGSSLGLVHEKSDNSGLTLTQRYYAYGQFSRYLRAGQTFIKVNDDTIAAYDMRTGTLNIVALNCTAEEKPVKFTFDGFDILSSGEVAAVRTSGGLDSGEHWQMLESTPKLYKTGFSTELAPNSVTTFTVSGVMQKVSGIFGDINRDGAINVTDVSLAAAHVKTVKPLSAEKQLRADVNGDGSVNVTDISLISAQVKGKRRLEPAPRYSHDALLTEEEPTDELPTDAETSGGE